jgi:hypothetical protein
MGVLGRTPQQVAHSLALLQFELTDSEFREYARTGALGFRAGVCALIKEAIAAGELVPCDAGRLARALHATLNGSILGWAIHGEGTMASWIRRDLRMVLAPYYRSTGARARSMNG